MTNYKHITSTDNPRYKQLRKLAHSPRERRKSGQTLLDGAHLLHTLAQIKGSPLLFILRDGSEQDDEIQRGLAVFPKVEKVVLTPALFDALSPVDTPTGILTLYSPPSQPPVEARCAVLLENIQDPGNLGSILRTAAAAGADAVYLSRGCTEAWSPKALRAAMGAHFVMPIYEREELEEVCAHFPMVIATTLGAEHSLYDLDLSGKLAFLFGNEGAGLGAALAAQASHRIRIPMPGKVESLNVAAAAAVCLYERVRQVGP